jgi:hypothetical protein
MIAVMVEVGQENAWSALTAFFSLLTPVVLMFSIWLQDKWRKKAATAVNDVKTALKVSDVKQEQKMDKLQATATQTHVLVNSKLGDLLRANASVSRRYATLLRQVSGAQDAQIVQDAESAAHIAEIAVSNHQTQQDIVDDN